jgi:hypothetical protein
VTGVDITMRSICSARGECGFKDVWFINWLGLTFAGFADQVSGASNPNAIAFALKNRRMSVIGNDVLEFGAGEVIFLTLEVQLRQLHFGARIGMLISDLLPELEGGVFFAESGHRFGQGHQGVSVVVFWVFGNDGFEEGAGVGGLVLAEQALAEVGPGVDVLRVAFHGGTVGGLGFCELSLLEVNITELKMMMGFVEVMDLSLKLLDAAAVLSSGQFEAAGRGGSRAVNREIIEKRRDAPTDKNEHSPKEFAPAQGVNQHPKLEQRDNRYPWICQPVINIPQV